MNQANRPLELASATNKYFISFSIVLLINLINNYYIQNYYYAIKIEVKFTLINDNFIITIEQLKFIIEKIKYFKQHFHNLLLKKNFILKKLKI